MGKLVWLFVAVVAAGCADDDPHELGRCGDTWPSPATRCEAACEQMPDATGPRCARATCTPNGESCRTSDPTYTCGSTFTVDGHASCCGFATRPDGVDVLLFECVE